jgi:hypothetical protein
MSAGYCMMDEVDESKFDRTYVPDHPKERVRNWRSLSPGERLELSLELSEAAWAKIGVVRDPSKPMVRQSAESTAHRNEWEMATFLRRAHVNVRPPEQRAGNFTPI